MDLDWLQTFVVAAEEQNLHRAAERLHLSQPTVSLHIKKLEQAWGMQLFDRVGRNIQLSKAGRRFLVHATAVLNQYQVGWDDMLRWQQGYEETLTLAVSPLIATTFLPQWIRAFSRQWENIEFSIHVMESRDILDSLLSSRADIGLSRLYVAHPTLHLSRLYADPVIMVAPVDEHDFEGPPKSATDLFTEYTVLSHNHPEYWEDVLLMLRRRFPFAKTMQVSQVHVTLHFIAERMGVSFLPMSTVQRELLRGSLMEVPIPGEVLPTAATYLLRTQGARRLVLDFCDFVEDYMKLRSSERTL